MGRMEPPLPRNPPPSRPSMISSLRPSMRAQVPKPPEKVSISLDDVLSRIHDMDLEAVQKVMEVANAVMRKRVEEIRQQRDDTCTLCLTNKKNIAFPCGHVCCCDVCANKLQR